MSEWIKSHANLADHPKVHILADALSVRNPSAIGTLHLLWWFALRFAWRTGDLERFGPVAIARACQWDGTPGDLISGLQKAGFLDGYKVHDWLDFSGRLVKDRIRYSHTNGNRPHYVRKRDANVTPDVAKSRVDKSRVDKSTTLMVPPTLLEAQEYAKTQGWGQDEASQFWNHHEASGWIVKGRKMKKWKAAFHYWHGNEKKWGRRNAETNNSARHHIGVEATIDKYADIEKRARLEPTPTTK